MITSIIQTFFLIKTQLNRTEQEKKWQRIYDLLNAENKPKFLCLLYTKQRKLFFFLQKKSSLRKRGIGGLNKKKNQKKAS